MRGGRIELMRFLQAGDQDLIALEPEHEVVRNIASEAGYQCTIQEEERRLVVQVKPQSAKASMLLFDASDPANIGWFSRCQFYVDGLSGSVLQTPLILANCRDGQGRLLPMLRISVSKELPASFRLPGRQPVNEQVVYALFHNILSALKDGGVAICGKGAVSPLAGGGKLLSRRKGWRTLAP